MLKDCLYFWSVVAILFSPPAFSLVCCYSRSSWVTVMQHPNFETPHPLQTNEQQEAGFDPVHNFNKNRSSTLHCHKPRLNCQIETEDLDG